MLTPIIWKKLLKNERSQLLQRPVQENNVDWIKQVQDILNRVRLEGDRACLQMTQQYDGVDLASCEVKKEEFVVAREKVSEDTRRAMIKVMKQLNAFHAPQKIGDIKVETATGIVCESVSRPIQRVGLYIPAGSAPLVSTVFMLGVPAMLANCPLRILCSPPQKSGEIDPHILVAAELCGITQLYKLGGAQAIAAMAYGTETIPKVDKIFGPGNSWVTQAKILVSQNAAGAIYDVPAGPSEVMIIADQYANAEFIAADLLSQAEHGHDSQVFLVCTDMDLAKQVTVEMMRQIKALSRRITIEHALKNSHLIWVDTLMEAIDMANDYAPEHLIMHIVDPRRYIENIQNAGSVFLGPWSPESADDYASGTNHVLPTGGYAKSLSGLSVRDFMKTISIQELTKQGLNDIADTINVLATLEGLDAHKNAVNIRLGEDIDAK